MRTLPCTSNGPDMNGRGPAAPESDEDRIATELADEAEAAILAGADATTGHVCGVECMRPLDVAVALVFDEGLAADLLAALRTDAEPEALIEFRRALSEAIGEHYAAGVAESRLDAAREDFAEMQRAA